MIRDKKRDRQIILISHNANIVVATDSENIIVANQRGQTETSHNNQYRFEYVNGSIETSFDFSDNKSLSDLDSKGIEYQNLNIEEDEAARIACQQLSGDLMVPVITANDKDYVLGFDKEKIDALLGIAG